MSKNKANVVKKNPGGAFKPQPSKKAEPKEIGLVITPNDPVFFRDGKPFTMGEEVHTTGVFPPYPSVLQGALRSAYFAANPAEIPVRDNHEKVDKTEQAEFSNALLYYDDGDQKCLLFPFPADLLITTDGQTIPLALTERSETLFVSSTGTTHSHFLQSTDPAKTESTEHTYLTGSGMKQYLEGNKIGPEHWIDLKKGIDINGQRVPLLHEESRIGIGRNKHGVTQEGQLYRMTRRRMHLNLHFFLTYKDLKLKTSGKVALGSEGVSGQYETISQLPTLPGCALDYQDKVIYKLYVQSPAIVETDLPDPPAPPAPPYLLPCLQAEGIELLTYAMGRPAAVGGWDMKQNAPKPMRYAIPAGAVYYFRAATKEAFETIKKLHGQSVGQVDDARQGFGIVRLGIHKEKA